MKKTCIIFIILLTTLLLLNCSPDENGSVTIYNQHYSNTISKVTESASFLSVSVISPIYSGSSATITRDFTSRDIKKYYVWVGSNMIGTIYSEYGQQKTYYYKNNGSFTSYSY